MSKIKVFVQAGGVKQIKLHELDSSANVGSILQGLTADLGLPPGDYRLFHEGAEAPLAMDVSLSAAGITSRASVHVTQCKKVAVTVNFNGTSKVRDFGPGVPIHTVKAWAVGPQGFNLNPVDAADHVLQLTGTNERPDADVHIGSLAQEPGCTVSFDLVPKVRVEG